MKERITMIGLAGPTNSGKTTAAEKLSLRLGEERSVMVHFDDYDSYPEGSDELKALLASGTVVNWEDPKLFDMARFHSDMQKLSRGQAIEVQPRSRESIAAGVNSEILEPREYTIVEGLFVLHDPRTLEIYDFRFYLDLPRNEMMKRRLTRKRGSDPWDQSEYIRNAMVDGTIANVEPQKVHAHVVLDGMKTTEELVETIAAHLKSPRLPLKPDPFITTPFAGGNLHIPGNPTALERAKEHIRLHHG